MTPLAARFEDIADPAALKPRWRAVELATRDRSFFLGWTWIGSWLDALATAGIPLPRLLAIGDEQGDAALALIGEGRAARLFGAVPAIRLNEAGHNEGDCPFIEYNGLLARAGAEKEAGRAFCAALAERGDWRALYLSGVASPDAPLPDLTGIRRRTLRGTAPVRYVDLDAVRAKDGDYLALLSVNTRSQIRRAMREDGNVRTIDRAQDTETADDWLTEMCRLNAGKYRNSAWDSPFFRDFARRLVRAGLVDGSVDLLRISAGADMSGYLLNFVRGGQAMNYQSAFAPPRSTHSRPGLITHAAAVTHYAALDLARYSFLAGRDRYKQSLSTDAELLHWWTLERFDWRLEAEALARRLLRR